MSEIISKARYEAAGEAWTQARDRMDAALTESKAAEKALYEAEEALAKQEAAPGIPAYWHDEQVTAERCRVGHDCKVHGLEPPW